MNQSEGTLRGAVQRPSQRPSGGMPQDVDGFLFDLLMAVMNSIETWSAAARDPQRGLEWRDAVTVRMREPATYVAYETLVADAAAELDLPSTAPHDLFDRWALMDPWPDAAAIARLRLPYAFVTNCSAALARVAALRSNLQPQFVLSAEEAGMYKPRPEVYRAACRKLGTEPNRTLFVAGSPYDAAGAREAGLQARLVVRRPEHRSRDPSIPSIASIAAIVSVVE
jgi:2-haloacid dehalogenase